MKHIFTEKDFYGKLSSKFKPSKINFPIDFWTIESGEFFGDLLTDGSYQSDNCISYSNCEIENILSNLNSTNKLFSKKEINIPALRSKVNNCIDHDEVVTLLNNFMKGVGIHCNIRFNHRTKVFEIAYSRILGQFLDKICIPKGKRKLTNPTIPKIIESAPKSVISAFLRRVIANEAAITHDGQICIKQAVLSSHEEPKLLIGYKKLFKKLGVESNNPRISKEYDGKDGKCTIWEVYTRPYDIIKILKYMSGDSKEKLLRIHNFLMNVKRFRLTRNDRFQQLINTAKSFKKPFTVDDMLKFTDIKRTAVQDYLYRLIKEGFITRNNRRFYPNGSEPFLYKLTEKGEKF
jgi:predicted transcriptional regulator